MSVKSLKLIIVLLTLALLAACFRIYSQSEAQSTQVQSNAPYTTNTSAKTNRSPSGDAVSATNQITKDSQGYASIAIVSLPTEAQQVLKKIQNRGEFPYRQDGQIFSNREGVLPKQSRGYYQEYTVPTPGADNRGARRIVSGQGTTGDAATSGEYYYTSDHYRSFSRIRME
jgi:ribonuclease T1